ncbi:MAG: MBL fold metallo-hydrolase [Hyphomonadaceae bacterium]|nr:MBL fold metallo-hydrolase [Hyphomonadaceae bacterium]
MIVQIRQAILALAVVACASVPASVPYPGDAIVQRTDGYLYEPVGVAPRVTALMSPEPFQVQPLGNVTLIEQSDGVVLVDAGGSPAAAERIAAFVREIAPGKRVKAIVITHWHGDHVLGLRTLLAHWPEARTISTVETRASLTSAATARFMPTEDAANNAVLQRNLAEGVAFLRGRSTQAELTEERQGYAQAARVVAQHAHDLEGAARIAPNETFTDRLVIADRDAPVEILFLGRANTDGDAVVWLPRQRVLVTGDVVVSPIPFGFGSYPAEWIGVLERLKAYDFATLVPGHGGPMRDRVYLDRLIALLREVRAQARPDETLEEARARVTLGAQADAFTGGSAWRRRWFNAYWTQAIVVSARKEARGEAIVQGE